ncbi:hypothetical protein DL763_000501 [Monosporascus cannonballus]|nr:hypothetical protein DL763_000501 [Monosporascus cannonballus]
MTGSGVLLRAAPVLFGTSSLTFTVTVCEAIFIRPLVEMARRDTKLRTHSNRVLPAHGRWLWCGLGIVFSMYPLGIATAIINLATARIASSGEGGGGGMAGSQRIAAGFYAAGIGFSALHFIWGPRAIRLLGSIRRDENMDGDRTRDNTAAMEAWVRLNAVRGILTDFPQWVCYFIAFIASTWPEKFLH